MDWGSRDTVLGIGTKIGTFTLSKLQGRNKKEKTRNKIQKFKN